LVCSDAEELPVTKRTSRHDVMVPSRTRWHQTDGFAPDRTGRHPPHRTLNPLAFKRVVRLRHRQPSPERARHRYDAVEPPQGTDQLDARKAQILLVASRPT